MVHLARQLTTVALCVYSLARHKLTGPAVVLAFITAQIHAHPSSPLPFLSLLLFFALGTIATRIGHAKKAHMTVSSTGGSGAEGPRGTAQVLANSGTASIFIALGAFGMLSQGKVMAGVAAAYAAAAADTLGSEIGILGGQPRLVTQPWRKVPRGTNGGVTALGLGAGAVGSGVLGVAYGVATEDWTGALAVTAFGVAGSLVDSLLGALVQTTVTDKKTGRVIEGENGRRVMIADRGSRVRVGRDWLNNNGVNFAMTFAIGITAVMTMSGR